MQHEVLHSTDEDGKHDAYAPVIHCDPHNFAQVFQILRIIFQIGGFPFVRVTYAKDINNVAATLDDRDNLIKLNYLARTLVSYRTKV